jgi:hypothetical protein
VRILFFRNRAGDLEIDRFDLIRATKKGTDMKEQEEQSKFLQLKENVTNRRDRSIRRKKRRWTSRRIETQKMMLLQ